MTLTIIGIPAPSARRRDPRLLSIPRGVPTLPVLPSLAEPLYVVQLKPGRQRARQDQPKPVEQEQPRNG